jgi:hypothetical protein
MNIGKSDKALRGLMRLFWKIPPANCGIIRFSQTLSTFFALLTLFALLMLPSFSLADDWGTLGFPDQPLSTGEIVSFDYPLSFERVGEMRSRGVALFRDPKAPEGVLYFLAFFADMTGDAFDAYDPEQFKLMRETLTSSKAVKEVMRNEEILRDGKKALRLSFVFVYDLGLKDSSKSVASVREFLMIFDQKRTIQAECVTRTGKTFEISLDALKEEHKKKYGEVCERFLESVRFTKK